MFKRGKGKYNSAYTIDNYYDWYCATVSDPLPKEVFRGVFRAYIERIMVEVIYNSFEFNIGQRMGSIRVRDKDYDIVLDENGNVDKTRLAPNWGKTLKKWKVIYKDIPPAEWKNIPNKPMIYHENDHTDQTIKQWFWDKLTCNLQNQGWYKFNATRSWDRLLASVNKESNITYYK